jgi:glucose-1-phosphate cytidylyltransferase
MKTAILAGGLGTRLSEETEERPKPMVEIGGKPILWHIMMHYSRFGFAEFVVALGYKGEYIKQWFANYVTLWGDLTVRTGTSEVIRHRVSDAQNWTVDLVNTGIRTQTGGRVKRLAPWLGNDTFMLTWGDGVSNVDLDRLLAFHRSHGKLATVTAVRPRARFGHLEIAGDSVAEFNEKPETAEGWINGAFFVLEPAVFDYIEGDDTHFEREPLMRLAADNQLMAYKHYDFWQCMDTLRDKRLLERLWDSGQAPWRTWD